jgi:serine/threonine-protein kinase
VNHPASSASEKDEEARALLQTRLALFWKVMFFINGLGVLLGLIGVVVKRPGVDALLTALVALESLILWQICRRGVRSFRFSRMTETVGLFMCTSIGAFLGRYLYAGFIVERSITSAEGLVMADGYVSMLEICGSAMMLMIRAALVPSRPRRTVAVTAFVGIPLVLVPSLLVPDGGGGFVLRASDSAANPWLPSGIALMWMVAIGTCSVTTWVIYGLRAEVRKARRFGQYVLERKLGEGGMGEVYEARHGMMRRPSAIKLLRPDRAGEKSIVRFEREVQLTAKLTHPNTITIFDYGRTQDGIFYYAMELLDGATLERIVAATGAQPPGRVVRTLAMACGALREAHDIGFIHRDIKPANIMLCTRGGEHDVVKVLDFGLVKELDVDPEVKVTGASTLTGTPQYMAPESIKNPDSVDARTDIYALGAVAYYLLAGVDVFDGETVVEVVSQHLLEAPKPFSTRGIAVPGDLEAVVLACLEKDPKNRPQTALELKRRLEACAVEPWDAEQARAWWHEHGTKLEHSVASDSGVSKTVAVDALGRS